MSCGKARSSFSSERTTRACVPRTERLPPEGAGTTGDAMGAFSSSTCPPRSKLELNRSGHSSFRLSATNGELSEAPDVVLLCDECVSRVVVLRQEGLRVLRDGRFSISDPKLPLLLYESLHVPVWINLAGCCEVCFAHLSQLKQEAIHAILTQNRTIWPSSLSSEVSPVHGPSGTHTQPKALASQSPSPNNRRRSSILRTESWVREQSRSETLWSVHNGVSSFSDMEGSVWYSWKQDTIQTGIYVLYTCGFQPVGSGPPVEVSQDLQKKKKDDDKSTVLCNFRGSLPFNTSKVSAMLPTGPSAAFSFIVRAVQKLTLTTRRRKQGSDNDQTRYPTNFSVLLQKSPPPVPSSLLQTPNKRKELSELGKVKVMLRVSPFLMADTSQFHALKLDIHKKQVTVLEPNNQNTNASAVGTTFTPKMFTFDATFGPESSQATVCERSLSEVLHSVVAGVDGCILNFGQTKEGTSYTMIGFDDSMASLGIIPCAISWLFKLINKKIERTWANISVSVSAVEVCGETEVIRDLLSHVEPKDHTNKSGVSLQEDPVCGTQLCNNRVVGASTAERAAILLDAALASRSTDIAGCRGATHHQCHMFYTIHVCQKHIESSPTCGMYVDQSKLSLIDLGNCTREKSKNNTVVCLVDLGNVIMAKLNRHNHVQNKGSKLAMLMQEALGNINCRTTIIAHVSTLHDDLSETLCTIQIVSQIRRLQRSRKQACSSPGGRSLKEKKANYSTTMRGFQYSGSRKHNLSLPCLLDNQTDSSVSDKSCDTVICMDPNSGLLHKKVKGNQEVVPIITSLQRSMVELKNASSIKHCELLQSISPTATKKETKKQSAEDLVQSKTPDLECFKCNTFAELQDRLGGIDESDMVDIQFCKKQPLNNVIKSEPLPRKAVKKTEKPGIQSPIKKYISNKEKGHPVQGVILMKNNEKGSCGHAVQGKMISKNLSCSPRLDTDSNSSLQCEQVAGSKMLSETLHNTQLTKLGLSAYNPSLPSETRTSPMGKSSSSLSVGIGSQVSFPINRCEVISQFSKENQKEKATITVTVQQPLDLNGHDELIYSVVREVSITGTVNEDKAAKIASNADPNPSKNLQLEVQPVKIIGSVGGEQTKDHSVAQVMTLDKICNGSSIISTGKAVPSVQNLMVNTEVDKNHSYLDVKSKDSLIKDVSEEARTTVNIKTTCRLSQLLQYACETAPDQHKVTKRKCKHDNGLLSGEFKDRVSPVNQKLPANFQNGLPEIPVSSYSKYNTSSLTSVWLSHDRENDYKKSSDHCVTFGSEKPHSSKATIEKKHTPAKVASVDWGIHNESMTRPVMNSTNKNLKYLQPVMTQTSSESQLKKSNKKCLIEESSKLFSAKLEQLTNRSHSLGRSHLQSFDIPTIEESNTILTQGSSGRMQGSYTSPRNHRKHLNSDNKMVLASKGSLEGEFESLPAKSITSPALRAVFEEDHAVSWDSHSLRRVPRFFPFPDEKETTQPSKPNFCNILPLNKLLSSTVVRKLSGTSPNLCTSPKSIRHSMNRSSSLSPDGVSRKQISWSSQSLSRNQGKGSLPRCPSRLLKGRVELLRASGDSLSSSSQDTSDIDELEESKRKMKLMSYTLPSPYSRITAPRKPKHCSGHASDNTSVLSGELPPAMYKTALLYNRNSLVSSGYESLKRDSETTYSSTSIHDSFSDQSFSTAKNGKSIRKRTMGSNQRRPSLEKLQSLQRSTSGSKIRCLDQGTSDSYEIKVYEIDNMDSLQRRGKAGSKSVVCFSAKLKFLEHRQQRIAGVRAKYNTLKRELEQAKQHLMVDPGKWTREFDLWQTFEVDSLEHLEALELVTERLECQVSRCKAHVMMVTSFDASPKNRKKKGCWPPVDNKGSIGI